MKRLKHLFATEILVCSCNTLAVEGLSANIYATNN